MFGCLFDDERPAGVMTYVHVFDTSSPPEPLHACGFSGIENQGATCYLNSLLQTLLFTPEFREGLFKLSENELGNLEDREKGGKVRIIPLQLQRLFTRLLLVNQQAASTTELTDSFGWSNKEELQQHDVQELNRILFSAIESSLVGTSGKDLISKLYHGSTVSEIVCQICGKISEKEEDFLDLNVIVANCNSLQESLNTAFLQKEVMKGKNQYRCSTCCNLVDAKKGLKIRCLPPILTFSLLRFSYDLAKGERYKETGKFAFPLEIDMTAYCDKQMCSDTIYELFSVVVHSGSSYGGHYHAYIRDVDCLGKWLPPDEEPFLVPQSNESENCDMVQGPVALIKALLLQQQDRCLPIEALCLEITKVTGMSWNKRFKKYHGPINKFLQKRDDVFFSNPATSMVYLKDEVALTCSVLDGAQGSPVTSAFGSSESIPNSPKESKKNIGMNTLKLNIFDKKRGSSSIPGFGHCWFDFNDSRVRPVNVKDIEKQYGGKESAYMLFFRRKSLVRPIEASGNPKYMMPERLLKFAENENKRLEKLREQYETTLNTVTLQVHLGENYFYRNGALEAKNDVLSFLELKIDKRKCLDELQNKIADLCSEICPSTKHTLHIAREVPAGLHLYEELSPSQHHKSLKDLGILEGTKIFVWDGNQIGNEIPLTGASHEPILLNVTATLSCGLTAEIGRGFPKSITLGELKIIISSLVPIPVESIIMSRLDMHGDVTQHLPLTKNQDGCTLEELSFLDGDTLVAENCANKIGHADHVENPKPIVLYIQYTNDVYKGVDTAKSQLMEFDVDPECNIAQLKSLVLSKLSLDDTKDYRMRKHVDNQSRKPPLHENLTVKEACLNEVSCVIIEPGQPPSDKQVTTLFSVGVLAGDNPDFEVTVDKGITINQCLKQMLVIAGLTGEAWHVRKTNWCGEAMEQLSMESTLEEEGIQHGDFLLIMEGHLPPKGFLNFTVWLHPTFESLQNPQPPIINGLVSGVNGICNSLSASSLNDQVCGLVKLGEVELSCESTLGELKKYVLTLPLLSPICLPSVRYLRLRFLEGSRPGIVLRGLSNTLRKLKLNSHQLLCAQILTKEEDMMQHDILLNISQRIPDSKTYAPPLEFVWETSKSASPKSLKQVLSEYLAIPIHRLVIAKHFSEKFNWVVIDDSSNQKTTHRRWRAGKMNLRNFPYYLKDGDTIGVKDRLSDPDGLDDFSTHEDILGKEILKAAADKDVNVKIDKKNSRRHDVVSENGEWLFSSNDKDTHRYSKKSEVGITIHVEDFS